MSRRREATDLARALELSTQPTTGTRSTSLLRESSPPITPLPTKYMPQKSSYAASGAGGFMEQYHQQLQQAQSYYQQNSGLLAPASHSSRNTYVQGNTSSSRSVQPVAHQPYSGPKSSNLPSSKTTPYISDSSRSIPGAISLPDSRYLDPFTSRGPGAYPACRDFGLHTPSSSAISKSGDSTGLPSSGIQTSISGNTITYSAIPPAQQPRAHVPSSITTSSSSTPSNVNKLIVPSQIVTGGNSGYQQHSSADLAQRPSMIRTAPLITPGSSNSMIQTSSNSGSTITTFVSTVKTPAKDSMPLAAVPGKNNKESVTTGNPDDIVADSEGEEDLRDNVQETQDDKVFGATNKIPSHYVDGLGAGLMTPPVTDSDTTAQPASSAVAAAPLAMPAPVIAANTSLPPRDTDHGTANASTYLPTSSRPKPRKRVKAPIDSVTDANTPTEPNGTTSLHVASVPASVSIASSSTSPATAIISEEGDKASKPLRTYGSKDKNANISKRTVDESAKSVDVASTDLPRPPSDSTKRNGTLSKQRAVIDSDPELSDTPLDSKATRKNQQNTVHKADGQNGNEQQSKHELKRNGKKRAIITSDAEEDEQEKTPDSKRKKPERDIIRLDLSSPKTFRGSSIDPLDMGIDDRDANGKGGQMEVSVELSPSNFQDFGLTDRGDAGKNDKGTTCKTKSPSKVHFVDTASVNEEETALPGMKTNQPKYKPSRQDDAYDEPMIGAAAMDDEDDGDDFVPSGKKSKFKSAKAKKAAAPKAKAAKGKKASQAKGKNAKAAGIIDESVAVPEPATEQIAIEVPEPVIVTSETTSTHTEEIAEAVSIPAEVLPSKPTTAKKGKSKKAPATAPAKDNKSSRIIPDDEESNKDIETGQNSKDKMDARDLPDASASLARVTKLNNLQTSCADNESDARGKTVNAPVDSPTEDENYSEVDKVAENKPSETPSTTSKVLQPKTSVLNTSTNVKIEPSFVVDKNGNVKEFRTCRTDLPKVVQTTGGVKRMGFSRRTAIPSLHKIIKLPPKRLPPPPKKPTRKKEDSDDDSDELDENGKKKIRPGDPEWYMMDVD